MFAYYLRLALASFRRNPGLTALMVFAIALGISVCMITLTSYRAAAQNPAGERSKILFAPSIDSWDPERGWDEEEDKTYAPTQLTYRDARGLYASDIPDRKVIMYKAGGVFSRADKGMDPEYISTRMTTGDFFAMFEVPFLYGGGWDARADAGPDPVVVLSKETNQKAFGGENSVGRMVTWHGRDFRVIGVLNDWEPMPKYFDVSNGSFTDMEGAYIPFSWGQVLELGSDGNTNCWKTEIIDSWQAFLNSECVWFHAWFEIRSPEKQRAFREFLDNYVIEQKKHGRFPRPLNNYLYDVDGWLKRNNVVGDDNRAMLILAFAFLAVCLVNTVGLLLAKFLNAAPAAGVRRALGASRRDIFWQHLTESGMVALAGGIVGGLLGLVGIWALRAWYNGFADEAPRQLPIDETNFVIVIAIAVLAGLLAGLYPAWRIGRAAPASYLKVQ
ncbi:MAG TPA: ABC transporter permease [Steroidobacteraceae bacterium]|jgi:putative ABC transport system permease protein|nr:ABC transporter permease [Steroidobacteraceae bacterium]